jgi:hypothetical protein
MQIHGGYGMTKDLPFERWYREMRIRRVGEGPNEVQRHVIARDLLGPDCARQPDRLATVHIPAPSAICGWTLQFCGYLRLTPALTA